MELTDKKAFKRIKNVPLSYLTSRTSFHTLNQGKDMGIQTEKSWRRTLYVIKTALGTSLTFRNKQTALSWLDGNRPMHETPNFNKLKAYE